MHVRGQLLSTSPRAAVALARALLSLAFAVLTFPPASARGAAHEESFDVEVGEALDTAQALHEAPDSPTTPDSLVAEPPPAVRVADAFDRATGPTLRLPRPFDLEAAVHEDAEAKAVASASHRLAAHDALAAQKALGRARGPAASLLQARIDLAVGSPRAALAALERAGKDPNLRPWVALERGRAQLALGEADAAITTLSPLSRAFAPLAGRASVPLAQALAAARPGELLATLPALRKLRDGQDGEARSLLLEAQASAEDSLGQAQAAKETRLRRYLQEPLAKATPQSLPSDMAVTPAQLLGRIELLVDAHRNEAAFKALDAFALLYTPAALPLDLACRHAMARGVVARKRHRYREAEEQLGWVGEHCQDEEQKRRAAFVRAKVISIQDGLRALPAIEAFVAAYPAHSMADDVLFWAGDSLQRRGREVEAAAYYRRILALERPDDQCTEASWRLGWMALRAGRRAEAKAALERSLAGPCPVDAVARARTNYWLGRIYEEEKSFGSACASYERVLAALPLSFYAQQALPRLLPLQRPVMRRATLQRLRRPAPARRRSLCAGSLVREPGFARGLYLLGRGLHTDALAELRRLVQPGPAAHDTRPLLRCGNGQTALLLNQLLERVGGHKEAHARLLRDFAAQLQFFPTAQTLPIWQAAYPLAHRTALATAERASELPTFLLQALSREESRFDAEVVSWAEAIGLTQLLLPSAQLAGRTLQPQVVVHEALALHDPQLNARLGGALLAYYSGRLGGSWPLALAAYNGGQETAASWWKRFAGEELALFAEEMTIFETRTYVQRVLQTFGIYRWLYTDVPPKLPCAGALPAFGKAVVKKAPAKAKPRGRGQ